MPSLKFKNPETGEFEVLRLNGNPGKNGTDGISPVITENVNNSSTVYKLDITDKNGVFTTPNLQAVSFVENASVYSTEETVVGTWIDGKPIYRTTIVATAPTSSNNNTQAESTIDVSHLSVDLSVDISGIMIEPTPSHIAINSVSNFSSDFGIAVFYISANRVLKIRHKCSAWSGSPMYINFEYTKTTDTATNGISTTALMDAYEEGVNEA